LLDEGGASDVGEELAQEAAQLRPPRLVLLKFKKRINKERNQGDDARNGAQRHDRMAQLRNVNNFAVVGQREADVDEREQRLQRRV
jgi:hypothetical protein